MSVSTFKAGEPIVPPPGYSEEDVAQTKALADALQGQLEGVKGYVAMSAVLTTFQSMLQGFGPDQRFRAGSHLMTVGGNIANAAIDEGVRGAGAEKSAIGIAQQVSNVLATEKHDPAIDALLIVLKALAQRFPCCTKRAADGAAQLAQELATAAALTAPGQPHQVH